MPRSNPPRQAPRMPYQCQFSHNVDDPNIRGLYRLGDDGYYHYVRDIPVEQCPTLDAHATALTVHLVRSFVQKNKVSAAALGTLIGDVHESVSGIIANRDTGPGDKSRAPTPTTRTVFPNYLVSLEDGGRYKVLNRHLAAHGLTPADYRRKWGLPADYPMRAAHRTSRRP